jgi:catechol 2,3-dioxygenase-like lactoylglutathione lyase family enzyme
MPDDVLRPARRFLHVCYCCSDASSVTSFFVDHLAMRNTMNTTGGERSSGAILGMEGEVLSAAAFVYDARGPRTSPAIEVQGWVEPPLVGTPVGDPTAAGIQALGFSVPALDAACERLAGQGCSVLASGTSVWATRWATVRDTTGVTLDLVEDDGVPAQETRMRHLRITVTDLAESLRWYGDVGFHVVARSPLDDASFLGVGGRVDAEAVRMRLPDEPFEAVLIEWREPRSHGRHVREPNHAGLYRTAIGVDDTRASYEAMVAAGVTFDRAPVLIELRGTPVPDMWICFLSDPDGVPFEFVERPRSAFRP